MINKTIVINCKITEKFNDFIENGRILLFEALCGFEKTTAARSLLGGCGAKKPEYTADEIDFPQ